MSVGQLTVDHYHTMIRFGILTDDDPVELLEGWLVERPAKTPPHRLVTGLLREALQPLLPTGSYVDSHHPITFSDSEPEPDAVIVRGDPRDYLDRHPGPNDLVLLVEVADATLQRDRTLKKRLHAAAEVAVYWIVNLIDRQIEVYSDPSGPADQPDYRQRKDYVSTDTIPVLIDGREIGPIAVADVLP